MERFSNPPRVVRSRRLFEAFTLLFCLCANLGFPGVAGAQDRLKVAVVNVAKIFAGYYKSKEVAKVVVEARKAAENQIEKRLDDHHRLVEGIARLEKELENPALSGPARTDSQKQRNDEVQKILVQEQETRELRASTDRNLQELNVRLRNQIVEDIMVVVRARVESRHFDLIMNKSAQGAPGRTVVLYANPSLDLTDEIVATLNKDHPASHGDTPAPSPEL